MTRVQKIINAIKKENGNDYYILNNRGRVQMFDCSDCFGDEKITIYDSNGIEVLYCPIYDYIEVFGLTNTEYEQLFKAIGY